MLRSHILRPWCLFYQTNAYITLRCPSGGGKNRTMKTDRYTSLGARRRLATTPTFTAGAGVYTHRTNTGLKLILFYVNRDQPGPVGVSSDAWIVTEQFYMYLYNWPIPVDKTMRVAYWTMQYMLN